MRRALLIACALALPGAARGTSAREESVVIVDGDVRLRREDGAEALRVGQVLSRAGGVVTRTALRGETIAFQVVVVAGERTVQTTALALADPAGPAGARLRAAVFREHYRRVDARSRNQRTPSESLGWRPGARPPDAAMQGYVPDTLVPAAVDIRPVAPGPAMRPGAAGMFWVDVHVPDGVPPGRYQDVAVLWVDGNPFTQFTIEIDVRPAPLPFRAASVFTFYEVERLPMFFGAAAPAVERQLWQLLHAHHVDALAELSQPAHVDRLAAVYDGTLFSEAAGYHGPGAGRPPAVVALGAYGTLRAPMAHVLPRVDAMVARLPAGPELFLYAIDESCASPRAGEWKQAFAAHPPPRPVAVAQTCDDPPGRQAVDIAMLSASTFTRGTPAEARASGRRAFIYNGVLPRTGTLALDADPRGLIANGWIAATMAIERWFYWESIYWNDDYRGGHGPVDPFVTAESFHNSDGDAVLGDGILLYPGRQQGRFAASSLGTDAVFPSLRLKAIRRGLQDAGLIALAAREQPEETARLVARALPAALDEADLGAPAAWDTAPLSFEAARAALRALVTRAEPMTDGEVRAAFADLADRRRRAIPLAPAAPPRGSLRRLTQLAPLAVALAAVLVLGFAIRARYSRRRRDRS